MAFPGEIKIGCAYTSDGSKQRTVLEFFRATLTHGNAKFVRYEVPRSQRGRFGTKRICTLRAFKEWTKKEVLS